MSTTFRSREASPSAWWRTCLALVALLSLVAVACGTDETGGSGGTAQPNATDGSTGAATDVTLAADGPPQSGGTLTYGLAAATDGWNPTINRWAGDGTIVGLSIFDPLAAYAADGSVVPYLAEAFEHNDDFTEWTIRLREGPTFHDGTPVDAAAVVRTIEGFRASPLTSASLAPIVSVEAPDDRTVVIRTDSPWASMPVSVTGQAGAIAAPAQLDDPDGSSNPVGSGPFRFVSWEPGSELVVERYPDYWRTDEDGQQLPYLDGVDFRVITDVDQRVNALETGELDLTWAIESEAVAKMRQLSADGQIQTVEQPGQTEVAFAMLNLARPPFDDRNARLALAHATDRDTYSAVLTDGVSEPAYTLFRPGTDWWVDVPLPGYDLEAAQQDGAAWSAANGGQPLAFTYSVLSTPAAQAQGELLQQMWEQAGMQVELQQKEATAYLLDAVMGDYQAVQWGQFGSPDPDYEQVWWRGSNAKPLGEISLNFPRHVDEATDAALDDARATQDPALRKQAYETVQERFAEDLPYVYLTYIQPVVAATNRVRGITNGPLPDGQAAMPLGGPGSFSYHTFLTQTWVTGG